MDAGIADPELDELRQGIARIDHALVHLMAARFEAARRAIRHRSLRGDGPTDVDQEALVLDRAHRWASEVGLPPELVAQILRSLVEAGKDEEFPREDPAVVRPSATAIEGSGYPARRVSGVPTR